MATENESVQNLIAFLRSQNVAVLATVRSGNLAHAASIYFYVEDDLRFYFLTKDQTKKVGNIKENHSVALAIVDATNLQTVQVEGIAKEVDYSKEYGPTVNKLMNQLESRNIKWDNMPLNHIRNSGYFSLIQITPTWIRWSDYKDWEHTVKFEQQYSA